MARHFSEEAQLFVTGQTIRSSLSIWNSISPKCICDLTEINNLQSLQVNPPSDIIPEVVRGIITYMNITNAAVLYDETFSMYSDK